MAEPRFQDFDDLRDNRAAEIQADIAVDLLHADPARLAGMWQAASDGEFRLALTRAAADYWEAALQAFAKRAGVAVPEDHFAIEILLDSYADPEMGHTVLLELHAYCGTERVGDLCWDVFDDAALETRFCREFPAQVVELLSARADMAGLSCEVEVTEVAEL
ncbi:MAG: hypothetical protein IH621_17555 [Krumholzibacteria bacterium]|nr:hypothetical protein [Candidatus Krumholzibacteria bacterium]